MYFALKAFARTLVLPPSGPLLLAALGAVLLWRRRRFGRILLILGLASSWLLATPIVADTLIRLVQHYPALDLRRPTNARAIVILGGGGERWAPEYDGPAAEFGLLDRLSFGAFVARRTALPVLVSGAPWEAVVMQTSLSRDFGVQARWVDNQSGDTYENAHFSARLLYAAGIKRVILVTSTTHMWRASHEFEDVGMEVIPAPVGVVDRRVLDAFWFVPSPTAVLRSNAAIYELLGEPARRVQAALGIREHFDKQAALP